MGSKRAFPRALSRGVEMDGRKPRMDAAARRHISHAARGCDGRDSTPARARPGARQHAVDKPAHRRAGGGLHPHHPDRDRDNLRAVLRSRRDLRLTLLLGLRSRVGVRLLAPLRLQLDQPQHLVRHMAPGALPSPRVASQAAPPAAGKRRGAAHLASEAGPHHNAPQAKFDASRPNRARAANRLLKSSAHQHSGHWLRTSPHEQPDCRLRSNPNRQSRQTIHVKNKHAESSFAATTPRAAQWRQQHHHANDSFNPAFHAQREQEHPPVLLAAAFATQQ